MNKSYICIVVCIVMQTSTIRSMQSQPFSTIAKALLQAEVEAKGVQGVRDNFRTPTLEYDDVDDTYYVDKAIIKIERVVYKTDEQDALTHMVFAKIAKREVDPHYYDEICDGMRSGYLDKGMTCYIWQPTIEPEIAAVKVQARFCEREVIEKILVAHDDRNNMS